MMGIIVTDMLINIGLTLLAIFAISLLMTVSLTIILTLFTIVYKVDLTTSLLSLAAVAATLVDTAGLAYFWGLSIEPFFTVRWFLSPGCH